ncbi:ABC transporter substrate-binding protein [Actinomadura nitritigenes]|uniref:ABC transporter substrate-binding protein n=1 Tax=Actinomadura nitritigenes TaxID=134602 RepID=UPI003D94002C
MRNTPSRSESMAGRRMTRRSVLRGAALLGGAAASGTLAASLSACGGSASTGGSALQFWSRESFNNGVLEPLLRARVADFDRRYRTSVSVLFESFATSTQKELSALASNRLPNVAEQGQDLALRFAAGDHLAPVDDVFAELRPRLVDLQKDAFVTVNGHAYAIPWYTETRVLFYARSALARVGAEPPRTWDEWRAVARRLNNSAPGVYGFTLPGQGTFPGQLFISLAAAAGGTVLDSAGHVVSDPGPFADALEFLRALYIDGMPRATVTYAETDATQLFAHGKAGMYWYNGQALPAVADQGPRALADVGAVLTPVPRAGDVSRSFLGGFTLFIFAHTKNQELSKQLIRHLLEPSWYGTYLKESKGFALPVLQETAKDPFFSGGPISTLLEQTRTAVRYDGGVHGNAPFLGKAESRFVFSNPVIDVWTGETAPRKAAKNMLDQLKVMARQ